MMDTFLHQSSEAYRDGNLKGAIPMSDEKSVSVGAAIEDALRQLRFAQSAITVTAPLEEHSIKELHKIRATVESLLKHRAQQAYDAVVKKEANPDD